MKPSIGRTVIVRGVFSNGASEQPAVVTRVWGNGDPADSPVCVNLTVFPDCGQPLTQSSVHLYDSREKAEDFLETQKALSHLPVVAYWPDKV